MSYTDASCNDAFVINSICYKIHKESVRWFTAVNRCLTNNATLAVFDDNVRQYFPSILLSNSAWIGLIKSWWMSPNLGQLAFNCCNFLLLFQKLLVHLYRIKSGMFMRTCFWTDKKVVHVQ